MPNIEQSAEFLAPQSGTLLAAMNADDGGLHDADVRVFGASASRPLPRWRCRLAWRPCRCAQDLKVSLNAPYDGSNAAFFLAEDKGYYAAEGLKVDVRSLRRFGRGRHADRQRHL